MNKIGNLSDATCVSVNQIKSTPQRNLEERIDLKNLYSEKELKSIVKIFGTRLIPLPKYDKKDFNFDIYFYDNQKGRILVINNRNCTNCTAIIEENGTATHTGSCRTEKLKGDYSDVYQDAVQRLLNGSKEKQTYLLSQLNAFAKLGQTQIKL